MSGIYLITGAPGAGKSLFTIDHVIQLEKQTGRPVFYCRIPGINIEGWTEIQSMNDWQDLPDGAIILGDEIWVDWKARVKEKVPEHIENLRLHRKRGFDIYLITQDQADIDVAVRRLLTEHWHIARISGTERSHCWIWPRHQPRPNDLRERQHSKDQWEKDFPKHVYDLYKSADVHNIEVRPPRRLMFKIAIAAGGIAFICLPLLGYVGYQIYDRVLPDDAEAMVSTTVEDQTITEKIRTYTQGAQPVKANATGARVSSAQQFVPVLPELPWTSPFYADVYKANTYPRPSCMVFAGHCRCYTQQATRMQLNEQLCWYYAKNGFFDPSRDDSRSSEN